MKSVKSCKMLCSMLLQDESCIGGLVLFLSNPDTQLVKLSLEVSITSVFIRASFRLHVIRCT